MPKRLIAGWPEDMKHARLESLLTALPGIAHRAGDAIMEIYGSDFAVRGKADASPVTEADECAERLILADLHALAPDIPVVSEEDASRSGLPDITHATPLFWLVDPLDGTREFVDRNGEFTVNVALIENGVPILGVVYAPAIEALYTAAEGIGAFFGDGDSKQRINVRSPPPEGLTVLASRSHGDEEALQRYLESTGAKLAGIARSGSSLKLCLVAAGSADLYPRLGRTMEWDIAAGHAVLRAAGGRVRTMTGEELAYGTPGFENPHFVATGSAGRPA
jgi:3'(2'), 5'-bisphosphate nucleotidase